jgi:HK97 family phage portal protein
VDFTAFSDKFSSTPNTFSGVNVDRDVAMTLPAVWRCISLNSETIASLPVDSFRKEGKRRVATPAPFWLERPNDEYTWAEMIQEVQVGLERDENAYLLKVSTASGRLFELWHLAPHAVTPERLNGSSGPIVYKVATNAGIETLPANAILHIKGLTMPRELKGLSRIASAQNAIGQGLAAAEFGQRFFGDGAHLSGVVTAPGKVEQPVVESIQKMFTKRHGGISKSHALGVLTGGATWTPLSVKPEESQFLQTQEWTAAQIAYMFGIPPHYVTNVDGAKGFVTSIVESKLLWLTTGLQPRIVRLERAFSSLLPPGQYIKFNLDAFLRPTPQERADFYGKMAAVMGLTPDEIRALEDLDPLPDGMGEKPLQSVQYVWPETSPEVVQ